MTEQLTAPETPTAPAPIRAAWFVAECPEHPYGEGFEQAFETSEALTDAVLALAANPGVIHLQAWVRGTGEWGWVRESVGAEWRQQYTNHPGEGWRAF